MNMAQESIQPGEAGEMTSEKHGELAGKDSSKSPRTCSDLDMSPVFPILK